MMKHEAHCDSPSCLTVEDVLFKGVSANYPDAWTVLSIDRSRITGLSVKTYAFCSADCLSNWAYELAQHSEVR